MSRLDVEIMQVMIDTMVGIEKFSYPARQNDAPKPAEEFAHIRLLEEYQVGIPNQRTLEPVDPENPNSDLTTTFVTISPAKLRFRVGVVDTDGIAASKIQHGWTSEVMKQLMISTGYGFVSCKPLSNEDAKLEKEWETRQGFSIEMYVTRAYREIVDNITAMTIDANYVEGKDLYNSTIIINN